MFALTRKLGPGLLFAASAVGVSHLVQSTRAGADFGLTMAVLILLACLVKYPAFRFGAEYAAAARESVIVGYERQGRWLLAFFFLAIAIEGLAVIPAVSLVAAGMTLNVLGLELNQIFVTMLIVVACSLSLALGRYRLLEQLCKVFVVVFAVLTVVATLAVLPSLGGDRVLSAPLEPTRDNLFFSVAVAGWMPVGMGGAVFISLWVGAKSRLMGRPVEPSEARFDFNLSYLGTVILAFCFLLMGTGLLFGSDLELAENSVGFATQLVAMFTTSVGAWVGPVISIAALAVMLSTVLTVVDGFPRVYANVTARLLQSYTVREERLYLVYLAIQGGIALALLIGFLASFGAFIDFVTTVGFVTAPVIAFLNHRIMGSEQIGPAHRPPPWLWWWSACGVAILSGVSIAYLVFRFA